MRLHSSYYFIMILASMSFFSCEDLNNTKSARNMKSSPPENIDGAKVLAYLVLDSSQTKTGNTAHYVNGKVVEDIFALSICKYADDPGYYLFYCDSNWATITDTYHAKIVGAKKQ